MAKDDFQAPNQETRRLRDQVLLSALRSREQGFDRTADALEDILAMLQSDQERDVTAPDGSGACIADHSGPR